MAKLECGYFAASLETGSIEDYTLSADMTYMDSNTLQARQAAEANEILDAAIDENIEIDTKELCERIRVELRQLSIPQHTFSTVILNRHVDRLKKILRRPKPWRELKFGRDAYRRMYNWLQQPLDVRLSLVSHVKKGRNRKRAFTDDQMNILQGTFDVTQNPTRQIKEEIAQQLNVAYSKIDRFFAEARKKCRVQNGVDGCPFNNDDEEVGSSVDVRDKREGLDGVLNISRGQSPSSSFSRSGSSSSLSAHLSPSSALLDASNRLIADSDNYFAAEQPSCSISEPKPEPEPEMPSVVSADVLMENSQESSVEPRVPVSLLLGSGDSGSSPISLTISGGSRAFRAAVAAGYVRLSTLFSADPSFTLTEGFSPQELALINRSVSSP